MKIDDILQIMQNKLLNLVETRKAAVISGNLPQVTAIDAELIETERTVEQLLKIIQGNS